MQTRRGARTQVYSMDTVRLVHLVFGFALIAGGLWTFA